jgi:Mg2+ and Co2+ transporter CorA
MSKQKLLKDAQSTHDKASALVDDLRSKIAEKAAQLEEEEDMLDSPGECRQDVMTLKVELEQEHKILQNELATYSENDPTELENKKEQARMSFKEADEYSDGINEMESWLLKLSGPEAKASLHQSYGEEYDEEEGGLRELTLNL